jgi:hypothetical protein
MRVRLIFADYCFPFEVRIQERFNEIIYSITEKLRINLEVELPYFAENVFIDIMSFSQEYGFTDAEIEFLEDTVYQIDSIHVDKTGVSLFLKTA